LIILIIGLGLSYVALAFLFLDFFVDLWWFQSLEYEGYFILRLIYRYVTFSVVTLVFFLFFFFNFWVASRFLGTTIPEMQGNQDKTGKRKLLRMVQSGSMKVYTPLSLIMAIPIAFPFYTQWEKGLLYLFSPSAGIKDPVFNLDISFYLFSYPIYKLVQTQLIITSLILFLGIFCLYLIENRILAGREKELARGAKIHLTLLILITMVIQIWGFLLQGIDLLFTNTHQPNFFGPGFVEMWVVFPLILLTILFFTLIALSLISYVFKGKGLRKVIVFGLLFLISLWGYKGNQLSRIIEKWWVKPTQGVIERPFIQDNILATLDAYDLSHITTLQYDIQQKHQIITNPHVRDSLRNIPVWDRELLSDVYKQLQGIRPYYIFPSVDVDRYSVSGRNQQVYLAPREIEETYAKNWPSRHLQYTHGYGVVMTPAVQGGDESMTWFIRDIPTESDYGFNIDAPGIYYGFGQYNYAIVPNDLGEIDHPSDEGNVLVNYEGRGGVRLSFFKKILFSIFYKESKIFFTSGTNKKSRILFRRNFLDAIERVTPFFLLDKDPYMVITQEGLFWIQDAYTVSGNYPVAQPYNPQFNYIRNSVKIVVDAYHGSIDYYITYPNDPIIRAYSRMYPGLLKPLDKMPAELKQHLRYPKDLFEVQLNIYAEYHQTDPEVFYNHEDIWEMPKLPTGNKTIPMTPNYLTLNILKQALPNKMKSMDPEFLLVSPMSPRGRNNLRALALAGCDGDNYGKLFICSFPKGQQIYGPAQINTLIDQDTKIAQQLTLWDQAGSEVQRGRMIILPVGNFILYIQPVYLSSATYLKIPELKRLIVSQGDVVVMASSLEEAFLDLENKLKVRIERQKQRFPVSNKPVVPVQNDAKGRPDNKSINQEKTKSAPEPKAELTEPDKTEAISPATQNMEKKKDSNTSL